MFAALTGATTASAAVKPNPPTRICIDNRCTADAPSTVTGGIKWHPGHYVWVSGNLHTPEVIARNLATFDQLGNEPSIQGVQLVIWWANLEGPTKGDYSQGFKLLDTYLNKLRSLKYPKRLIMHLTERAFAFDAPDKAGMAKFYPAYLINTSGYNGGYVAAPAGTRWTGGLTFVARLWEAPVMDRLIALSQAYAARYDKDPNLEMVGLAETSLSPPVSGFSQTAYVDQVRRWYSASTQAWPHTQLRLNANYLGSDDQLVTLMSALSAKGGLAIGGPDPELPLPTISRTIQANQLFRAVRGGGDDLRGQTAWVGEQQEFGLGVRITQTPGEIFNYQYNTMRANYMIWLMNTWTGGAEQKWPTGILPYVRSINGKIHTECPDKYTNRCDTK
jgi:hypothetical protein